jgi:excisionase family DNA binding protein
MESSPAARSWARRYGIDLTEFTPLDVTVGRHSMTVTEAARELGIGVEQVRRLLRSGALSGVPLGGQHGWRVARTSVHDYRGERLRGAARRRAPA